MSTKGDRENPRIWTEAAPIPGITGGARWDLIDAQNNPRVKQELVVPVFVELLPEVTKDLNGLIDFLAKASDQYSVPDHVADRLQSEAESPRELTAPMLLTLLCRPDSVESNYWKVVAVGPPQARTFRRDGFVRGRAQPVKTGPLSETPVIGIIDDSIGFLNTRFRHDDGTTRFRAMWIMHNDTLAGDPGPGIQWPLSGIELTEAHINQRLVSGQSEMALYRQINMGVFGPATRHGTAFHAGHGTHVLDLAAGAGPGDPMASVPILGVQISPSSIGETSGASLDPDVMRALDWTVTRALQMPGRFPLVINISLGSLAGPQDGTGVVERWIASEIKRYHHFSGHAPVRVVIAVGNAHRARLVAEAVLAPGKALRIDWRILPDDATKSVLELRTRPGLGPQIGLGIQPADGGAALQLGRMPGTSSVLQYVTPSGVAAEVSADPEPNFETAIISVAPTTRTDPRPMACSGNWQITLQNNGPSDAWVSLKVQRDDTPGGYRRTGRQSWLDHAAAWTWEDQTRAYTLPDPAGPLTRFGTGVRYSGLQHPSVYFVGALRPAPFGPGVNRASPYSSMGNPPPPRPDTWAKGDDGSALTGVRAAGVTSGSTTRMSGTSMAAPQMTRCLLNLALQGRLTAQPNAGAPHDPADLVCTQQTPSVLAGQTCAITA